MKNWAKAIIVLALVAVAAGTVAYGALNYEAPTTFKATDYSQPENWLFAETDGTHEVDLFFLYPTVAKHSDYPDGSSEIDDQMRNDAAENFLTNGRAFAEYTNVYAPMYRQLTMTSAEGLDLSDYDEISEKLGSSLGCEDVINAIDYYFKHFNNGRPYIIAGHSQGSCLVLKILERYMDDHPEEYSRMIAAYAIGEGISQSYLDENPHIKFATGATDTGVLISWNTEGPAKTGGYMKSFVIPENCVLINPLTWSRSTEYASADLNKGEYIDLGDGKYTTLAKQNDAQINAERGSITCTTIDDYMPMQEMFGNVSLHAYDYKAYFQNITDNGYDRICAYLGYRPLVGAALDYSDENNWLRFDYTEADTKQAVDVFYLYPTCTSMDCFTMISEVDEYMRDEADFGFKVNADTLSGFTNIYAPFYRQMSNYGLLQMPVCDKIEEYASRSVVRTDVYAALDYYFDYCNEGRPFILASHSQGSALMKIALSEYMKMPEHQKYMDRMVAAYVPGFAFTEDWLDENDLKSATGPSDTGVIIVWNTYADRPDATGEFVGKEGEVCINPINWCTDGTPASASENKGSLIYNRDTSEKVIHVGKVSARIDSNIPGKIAITDEDVLYGEPLAYFPLIGSYSYHVHDWSIFYLNIRENAQERIDAYFANA